MVAQIGAVVGRLQLCGHDRSSSAGSPSPFLRHQGL